MESNSLISVIVPIFKVENYLDACVECLINQTYKNLEIILVDDGSPDSCPSKCDDWAARDSRIKVVHKKNGGLSSARNAGLEVATGKYFGFVDSDDLIANDMFEVLHKALSSHPEAAIASGMVMAFDGETQKSYSKNWEIKADRFIPANDFLTATLTLQVCHTAWTKLYRAEILKDVRFPLGKNNEDSYYMFELSKILEEKHLGMIEVPNYVYYYRVAREGSICNDAKRPLDLDILSNYIDFINYLECRSDSRAEIMKEMYIKSIVHFLLKMVNHKVWEEKYFEEYHSQLKPISYNKLKNIFKNNKAILKHVFALKYMPKTYFILKRIFNRL